MKKIILAIFLLSIICFSGIVKTGTFSNPNRKYEGDYGVYYVQKYKDSKNPDGYSFNIVYAGGTNVGECVFYNIKNPEKGVLYGTCKYKNGDVADQLDGKIFKFKFLDNGNIEINGNIYNRTNMTDENTIKQIDYFKKN